jgi:hypothetical protein
MDEGVEMTVRLVALTKEQLEEHEKWNKEINELIEKYLSIPRWRLLKRIKFAYLLYLK